MPNPSQAPAVQQPLQNKGSGFGIPQLGQTTTAPQPPNMSSLGPSNPMPQQPGDPETLLIIRALSDYLKFKRESQTQAPNLPMGGMGGMGSSGYKPMG